MRIRLIIVPFALALLFTSVANATPVRYTYTGNPFDRFCLFSISKCAREPNPLHLGSFFDFGDYLTANVILDVTPRIAASALAPVSFALSVRSAAPWIPFISEFVDPTSTCHLASRGIFDVDAAGNIVSWFLSGNGPCVNYYTSSVFGDIVGNDTAEIGAFSSKPGNWERSILPEPSSLMLLAVGLAALRLFPKRARRTLRSERIP